jgi:hypothetical protein
MQRCVLNCKKVVLSLTPLGPEGAVHGQPLPIRTLAGAPGPSLQRREAPVFGPETGSRLEAPLSSLVQRSLPEQ